MAQDDPVAEEVFQFTEADLISEPLKSTTWRERLSPIFKEILDRRYGKDFAVWQAIAGRARILIAEKKEKHPAYSHSMLYFDHNRSNKDKYHEDYSFGLWVQKGVVAGSDCAKKHPYYIMDNDWSWARMLSRLESDNLEFDDIEIASETAKDFSIIAECIKRI